MIKKLFKLLILLVIIAGGYAAFQIFWERSYRNEAAVEIQRPAAAVFPLLTSPAHITRWVGGLDQSLPLTKGGLQVGARNKETMRFHGKLYSVESEVQALQPNQALTVASKWPGLERTVEYQVAESGGRTTVSVRQNTRYTSTIGKVLADLDNISAQQKLERDLATLKALAESM